MFVNEPSDLKAVSRRVALVGTRLSVPLDPMPGEGLADILFRGASQNGYTQPYRIARNIGLRSGLVALTPRILAEQADVLNAGQIADILGTSRRGSLDHLVPERGSRGKHHFMFFGREVRIGKFFARHRSVSPRSLKKAAYQKAIWSLRELGFDPSTSEFLLSKCPLCDEFFSFGDCYGVERCGACSKAGKSVDLREYPQDLVEVDDFEGLKLVTDLINPEFPVARFRELPIPYELSEFGPGPLFELAIGMARLERNMDDREVSGDPVSPVHIASAGRALIGWPDKFYEFADRVLANHLKKMSCERPLPLSRVSGGTYNAYVLRHPISWICDKKNKPLSKLIVKTANEARRIELLGSLTTAMAMNAKRNLPSSPLLVDHGFIRQDRRSARRRATEILSNLSSNEAGLSSFDAAYMILSGSRPHRDLARKFGVPVAFLPGFVSANLIEALDPNVEACALRLGTAPADQLEDRILAIINRSPPPPRSASLVTICSSLVDSTYINPWPSLLASILSGELKSWYSGSRGAIMERIWITDIDRVRADLAAVEVDRGPFQVPVRYYDMSMALGVSDSTIAGLRLDGMIGRETLGDLWNLRNDFILPREIERRMSVQIGATSMRTVYEGLKRSGVRRHSTPTGNAVLYDRIAVETYFGDRLAPRFKLSSLDT